MEERQKVVLCRFRNKTQIDEENYADHAARIMEHREMDFPKLTTTKLRNIYGQIMNLQARVNCKEDFEKSTSDIQYLKVKMAYEIGREDSVKRFMEKTCLMEILAQVKSFEHFILYCRYAESLVAYFKYYGGKDRQ